MGAVISDQTRSWRGQLTQRERRVGMGFFLFYLLIFPFLPHWLGGRAAAEQAGSAMDPMQSLAIYYVVVAAAMVAVFWAFLRQGYVILKENFQPSVFAFGAGLLAAVVITCLVGLIPLPVPNQEIMTYKLYLMERPLLTWALAGALRPAVEEVLYRGFLFGVVRRENRPLAYLLSAGLFALSAVWLSALGNPAYLLVILQYIPLGVVLCWSYDVSGSVFVPVALRMAAQTLFLIFAAMTHI